MQSLHALNAPTSSIPWAKSRPMILALRKMLLKLDRQIACAAAHIQKSRRRGPFDHLAKSLSAISLCKAGEKIIRPC